MIALNPAQLGIILIVIGSLISFPVAAMVDALKFSPARWQQVGHTRSTWLTLMAIGTVCFLIVGVAVAVEYLRTVRPKLLAAPG